MISPFRILLALAFAGVASASIVPRKGLLSPQMSKQLSMRGGAGPLDPDLVTKVATGVLLAQGTVATLAPEPSLVAYGCETTPTSVLSMRRIGLSCLDIGLLAYGLIYKSCSLNTAAGMSSTIWALETLGSTLNDEATTIGFSNNKMMVWLAMHLATAYIYFSDAGCASTVMKAFAIFTIATCAPIVFLPETGFKAYGHDLAKIIDTDLALLKCLGAWITAIGVFIGSVAFGASPTKALGYAFVPLELLSIIMLFITKESDKLGTPKGPAYFWLILDAIIIATLAID